MKKSNTKVIVRAAFLVALSIVLTRFLSVMVTPQLRVGIGSMPIILSGMLYGPVVGGIVGLVTDAIGVMINPQGTPHLGFTLSSILTGLLPGLICMKMLKDNDEKLNVATIVSCVIVMLIVHIGLNTYWLSQLFGKAFMAMLPIRALKAIIETVITIILIRVLYKILKK
ncbi:folate family ECF transporter S component [Peptoniphilus mikwangii]|uniref:folate family ECF transporter S component n=1 Tax=Peptoniphilus mikwangii TaxID=1354300 RepID=UPI0004240EF3|nr:folate family ECF transporter S component [Peptoniphilus mikwangii]